MVTENYVSSFGETPACNAEVNELKNCWS